MEGAVIVVWICSMVVFFFILYGTIQSAIDHSKMAANIQEIRDLLIEQKKKEAASYEVKEGVHEVEQASEICPACGEKVKPSALECPDCGLRLREE